MALELTSLVFKTETSDLERASKVIGELVTNVGKLDKAARDAAQTEVVLAKAAKLNADANLQNAKAQDVRLKSTIAADKADQQATAAIEKKTKATEKVNEVVNKNVGVLQRQKDILEFQTQGFSRGQSSILSYAKAAGLAAEDIGELGKVLETQRKLMGGDPFDKSLSGLKSLQNQYTELKESVRQYATDSNLTAKQTRELARDKERLIEKMKVEGASFSEIRQAVRAHNTEYVNLATSYNKMTSAEDAVIKSRKEAVNATNYLTQADQKMAAALNTSNAALDKAGTDSLVKYESALRKSGVSQDVATQKLATYKAQLAQVAAVEEKRRAQHLTRALTPQISDVAVSLWSGQSPLTVLLQQGSQINDMFQLSGVAAADFGKTVKEAFSSMLPSILAVVKGVGVLLVDGFVAAGNAAKGFIAGIFGMTGAMDKLYMKMSENGPSKFGGMIQTISSIMTGVFAVGVALATAGLVALGIGLKQVISENDNLARSMAQSGASMAISTAQAFAYAKSMNDADISTGKAVVAITEMAKAGNFASSDITKVTEAAVNLNKYLGVSIEDTVKGYSKLKDEPVKAILDLAKASGNIPPEIIKTIVELERQGEVAKATSIAMTARFENDKKVIEDAKKNLSGFSTFVISLGNTISNFFSNTFKNIWYATDPTDELQKNLDEVRKKIKDVSATLESNKSWGISGDPKLLNSLKEQERMIISQIGAQVRLRGEEEKRKFLNAENAKDQEAIAKIQKEAFAFASKETEKTLSLEAFKKKFVDDKIKATGRQVELDKQTLDLLNKQAEAEYKKLHASGAKQTVKDLETEIDILNKRVGLTSSYNNELASLQRLRASGVITEQEYIHDVEELIKLQPFYIDQQKKLAEAEEHRLKLLGKSEGIGKQYYSDMQKLEEFAKVAGWSREEVEELTRAVFKSTPAWKAYEKALEDVNSAARKFNEDSLASQAATLKENQSLDYRLSLLGKTAEEQKALSIEYNRANKLREVDIKLAKQLREIEEKIAKAKKDGLPESDYQSLIDAQVQARKDAAEQEKVINREVAVQYAEDFDKEFRAIKSDITDSLVTALFEGGKAGSKKLRNLIVAELEKPVTMVVNAVVNTVLGSVTGGLFGGSAGATAAGGAAGSALSSIGGSMIGNTVGGFGAFTGAMSSGYSMAMSGGMGLALEGGAAMVGSATGMSSALAGIGQIAGALGPIALGVGALYSIISGFDDSGTYHTGGAAQYSSAGGLRTSLGPEDRDQFGIGMGWFKRGDQTISAVSTLAQSIVTTLDGVAVTFGQKAGYEIATAFADDSSDDGAWGALRISKDGQEVLNWRNTQTSRWAPKEFGDGEEGYKQYLDAIAKDTRQVILDMGLPEWANEILTDLGESPSIESLSVAVQQITVIQGVFNTLTNTLVELSGASDETLEALMTLSGGIEVLSANATAYYQNFYSAEEQRANVQKQLDKAFEELGLSTIDIDATDARQQFRDLVEAQDLTTESGRETYAALLAMAGTFASVTTTAAEVTDSIITLDDALNELRNETRSVEDIAQNILSLEQAVFEAQNSGNTEVLRNNILQGLTEQERVLQRQLWAIEDTRTAQDKLVSAYKDQVTALDSSINRLRAYSDSLKKFNDSLTLGELSPLTPSEQYAEAKRQYESTLALAMVGDVAAQNALQSSTTAFLQASRAYNASSSQYISDFNAAQEGLDFIASITQDQANNEQILRDAAVAQLELLGSIDESVTAVGERISSGLTELSNAILTGLSLGITPDQGVLDAVNNGLGGGQSSYYNSLPTTTTKSQSNPPIAIIPVNQASAMQSDSQDLVSLNSQLVEEVRNLTAQVTLLRAERQQDTRDQTQILATATTEAGTAVTEAINKSSYTQQVRTGATLN